LQRRGTLTLTLSRRERGPVFALSPQERMAEGRERVDAWQRWFG
jgi:hypothetical protein